MAKEPEKVLNIYQKLLEFQKKWITFEKTASNPHFKYKYTPLDDLNAKIKPALTELWLFIYHTVDSERKVTTTIIDSENSKSLVQSVMVIPEWVTDPQKLWSAITYFKRYNTVALLNLDSETDSDANDTKPKTPFDKNVEEKFKQAIVNEKFILPDTVEELYKKLEENYTLTKENKEELKLLYVTK